MEIAIQGHSTRGKEVIEILKNLGGINTCSLRGESIKSYYYIDYYCNNSIHCHDHDYVNIYCKKYTLEEFEREFPFKIGDLCIYSSDILGEDIVVKILGMTIENDCIMYEVGHKDTTNKHSYIYKKRNTLKPYKEMKLERNITLTLEKAKEWYKKGGELKEIALQAYSEEELNTLPRSWEEFVESTKFTFNCNLEYINGIGHWSNGCLPNKSIGESSEIWDKHLALFQLEQLRNCWRQGWKPEWNNCEKYAIKWEKDDLIVFTARRIHSFLVFPTREMAEEFLECFRDLIKKAGDLI